MRRFILLSLLLLISDTLISAPITPPPPPGGAPPGAPIHGLLYAIALAVSYGFYATRKRFKK